MAAKRNSPRKERDIRRKVGVRPVKKSFLIVCEGQNTEPDYFNSFRLTSATVKAVGKGLGTRVLVKEAVGIRQEEQRKGKTYDQYWVVFDKDDFPDEDFNLAIQEAKAEGFQVAWSNQAFEFWFILHFHLYQGPLHRSKYAEMLTKLISHAKTLLASFNEGTTPAKAESETTVFALAEQLRVYM